MRPLGHNLMSDLAHRDPTDGLHSVDDGKFLDALQSLPQSQRQLLEEGEMHVELVEIDGRYQIAKIIKKREAAYLQGSEKFFVFNNEGKRVSLTEEEYEDLLGMKRNPDDVFEAEEVDLTTLDSECVPPMDTWDVVYDATEYIQAVRTRIESEVWQELPLSEKRKQLEELQKLIYSADWFPYPADKRLHSQQAKEIATRIQNEDLPREYLANLLRSRKDHRRETVKNLRKQALQMPLGKERAQLLLRANELQRLVEKDMRRGLINQPEIPASDKSKLWALWREKEMLQHRPVQLMYWQFEQLYGLKLQKELASGALTQEQALEKLRAAMVRLFGKKNQAGLPEPPLKLQVIPLWLAHAKPLEPSSPEDPEVPVYTEAQEPEYYSSGEFASQYLEDESNWMEECVVDNEY